MLCVFHHGSLRFGLELSQVEEIYQFLVCSENKIALVDKCKLFASTIVLWSLLLAMKMFEGAEVETRKWEIKTTNLCIRWSQKDGPAREITLGIIVLDFDVRIAWYAKFIIQRYIATRNDLYKRPCFTILSRSFITKEDHCFWRNFEWFICWTVNVIRG